VDESGQSIVSKEIRFSSGVPFIMLLFLWTAYQFFSITMPSSSKSLTPAQFVGIATVLFTVVGLINIKIMASRMEKLIQDALEEIKSSKSP
jgi:multidrug transporter EmrE-like cation transporter